MGFSEREHTSFNKDFGIWKKHSFFCYFVFFDFASILQFEMTLNSAGNFRTSHMGERREFTLIKHVHFTSKLL